MLVGPTSVPPGSTREYTLEIPENGAQRLGGLNVAASHGIVTMGGAHMSQTQIVFGVGGLPEITHTSAKLAESGTVRFSFFWTAPGDGRQATLTAWGNSVNGDGSSSGDRAGRAVLTIGGPSLCDNRPVQGCKQTPSSAATLVLKQTADPAKKRLTFKWSKGAETDAADLGDPVAGATEYALCVYDSLASSWTQIMSATVPAGGACGDDPCWRQTAKGFTFTDKDAQRGIHKLILEAGAAGSAKIVVRGKGVELPVPVLPLFQQPQVVAQVVNSDGACWAAQFSAPAQSNSSKQFKDKSD
jgi:hypothetical protein